MKFIYSDTMDHVDPDFDFVRENFGSNRRKGVTDQYAHQILGAAPYDGLLVAMSGVKKGGRYSEAAQQRLLRDGVRKFLNFDGPQFADKIMMGDCGAFAYASQDTPPYSIDELVDFYHYGGFSHGCALDHIIFEFESDNPPIESRSPLIRHRYELTLGNAERFLAEVRRRGNPFVPIGVVQGWSPASMAEAAKHLLGLGYQYLAIGGLVPLKTSQIHDCLKAIRREAPDVDLHLLGFAKAESIHEFLDYRISSFDSTSPLIRAFKDSKANYYIQRGDRLEYYMALRVPQALINPKLQQSTKRGRVSPEQMSALETRALDALREYDKDRCSLEAALGSLDDYLSSFLRAVERDEDSAIKKIEKTRPLMSKTLRDRPWRDCSCAICRKAGIDVVIFRSSNRNKRRGMHNLAVYHNYLKSLPPRTSA